MREVFAAAAGWWRDGLPGGLATVTATWASAPRPPGTAMAVGPDGTVVGSVSGGCVEAAVYDLCQEATRTGKGRLIRFGVSDADAYEAGLTCGGTIELLVEPASFAELPLLAGAIENGRPTALLTRLADGAAPRHLLLSPHGPLSPHGSLSPHGLLSPHGDAQPDTLGSRHPDDGGTTGRLGDPRSETGGGPYPISGTLGDPELDAVAVRDAAGVLSAGSTRVLGYGGERVLVSSFLPPARMIVFGATDQAAATAGIGRFLGYRVTVCDARPVFATERRLPGADEVVVDWPHRYLAAEARAGRIDARTVLVVLTHDPKFDIPLLVKALRLPVAFVGAMGSRRTHDERLKLLRAEGLTDEHLARLASPIGLDLGARTPEETAVSIAAEIVALASGASGTRLSELDGPIHPPA